MPEQIRAQLLPHKYKHNIIQIQRLCCNQVQISWWYIWQNTDTISYKYKAYVISRYKYYNNTNAKWNKSPIAPATTKTVVLSYIFIFIYLYLYFQQSNSLPPSPQSRLLQCQYRLTVHPHLQNLHCPSLKFANHLVYPNIQIHKQTNIQIYKYTNIQIHKYTNLRINKYTNIQIYKYANI